MKKSKRKGIILSGGSGTRLHPTTLVISKQLLPIYNKPTIFYTLSTLMLSNIDEILIISSSEFIKSYELLLGDGGKLGITIKYKIQDKPNGLAEALILAEEFLDGSPSALILGDNLFYGTGFSKLLEESSKNLKESTFFTIHVENPKDFGVVEFSKKTYKPLRIIEKPSSPPSKYAVTGLYFYDHLAPTYAKQIKPSKRGELEITELNNIYLNKKKANVVMLPRGFHWFDTGTPDSLLEASIVIRYLEKNKGNLIGSPEEIALQKKWITKDDLHKLNYSIQSSYFKLLKKI